MSFRFNFSNPSNSAENTTADSAVCDDKEDSVPDESEEFKEIFAESIDWDKDTAVQTYDISETLCVRCLDNQTVESRLCGTPGEACGLQQAVSQHSDLIPNVYEGGLTVWECSIDLARYLQSCIQDFQNKRVLELGCGAGLPGIVAMVKDAASLHFQDYNREVIENYTIANVQLNQPATSPCKCRYFSGDWSAFKHSMAHENIQYDVILTAETIYKPDNYKKLSAIFEEYLAKNGTVYVAAKSNYFGVGGGVKDFEQFVCRRGKFHIRTCHTIDAGHSLYSIPYINTSIGSSFLLKSKGRG